MSTFLVNQQLDCARLLLKWGFCFAKSQTDYSQLAKILDNKLFLSIVKIIVEHFKLLKKPIADAWIDLLCGSVKMLDFERISTLQEMFKDLVSRDEM